MKKITWGFFMAGIIIVSCFLLGGCQASRTYLLDLNYDPSRAPAFLTETTKPVNLAVYNFQDARPDRLYLGRRVYRDGLVDFYKPDEGTVEQIITKSFTKLLEKAGFKVTLVNRYLDPEKEDLKNIPGDAALGGKIDALWVEAKSGVATTDTEAKMRLQIYWGLPKERTWIRKIIEGSAQESDRPFYQPKHAQAKINDVFKDSLDKLLKDETLLKEKLLKDK